MIGARLRRDAKITAQEGCVKFGHQFFDGISFGTEASGHITIKAGFYA